MQNTQTRSSGCPAPSFCWSTLFPSTSGGLSEDQVPAFCGEFRRGILVIGLKLVGGMQGNV